MYKWFYLNFFKINLWSIVILVLRWENGYRIVCSYKRCLICLLIKLSVLNNSLGEKSRLKLVNLNIIGINIKIYMCIIKTLFV